MGRARPGRDRRCCRRCAAGDDDRGCPIRRHRRRQLLVSDVQRACHHPGGPPLDDVDPVERYARRARCRTHPNRARRGPVDRGHRMPRTAGLSAREDPLAQSQRAAPGGRPVHLHQGLRPVAVDWRTHGGPLDGVGQWHAGHCCRRMVRAGSEHRWTDPGERALAGFLSRSHPVWAEFTAPEHRLAGGDARRFGRRRRGPFQRGKRGSEARDSRHKHRNERGRPSHDPGATLGSGRAALDLHRRSGPLGDRRDHRERRQCL